MSKAHFVLVAVRTLPKWRLGLTYADGQSFEVDLAGWVKESRVLAPLKDETLFMQARVGFQGHQVDWVEGELDLAADNLRNLGVEQAGGIGHERIWTWLADTGLTLDQAAEALGVSRRMLIYYRDGEKPIPRAIWLACLGWEATRPKGQSLPRHIPTPREYAKLHT